MELRKTQDAVGQMLCHDITQIIPGEFKGPVFRKGHIITEEDIPVLLSVGKDHVYIWEVNDKMMHENDAAMVLYGLCVSDHMHPSEIKEGKVELIADIDGLLKVDRRRLDMVNSMGEMMIACRHGNFPVRAGDKLAGTRIIPLIIEKEKMDRVKEAAGGEPILRLLPYTEKKVGIVTTGNEVYYGRIEDKFTPVVIRKVEEYGAKVIGHKISSDDTDMEIRCIEELLEEGCDFILCTGGMSVDPDDRTPYAIRSAADEVITYGAPVLPGAMFMLAYKNCTRADGSTKRIPIVGLPGCVMYAKRTIFDLILPRLAADDPVTREEIDRLGMGGLCLGCEICTFPNCGFGKS
ncbi:MAG: molybdopterin-binding protein [Lachnospiraceae bacterium]|nr:molybdopterin-binding protein [Lachnospiraceae bacterium]MBQ6482772.1 molybdopterin-binding protein [Anaerolineaceae bacterium]